MTSNVEAEAIVHELFRTEAGRRDPYPRLHRLRQVAPVHRSQAVNAWIITRHDHASMILRDTRFAKRFTEMLDANSPTWRDHEAIASLSRMMVQLDAPEHTRLRKRVSRAFTAARIEQLRPLVRATVAELLQRSTDEDADLLQSLAFTLPITVIGDLMGIRRERLASYREPTLALTAGLEIRPSREAVAAADAAARFFDEEFTALIAERRQSPGEDLVSALVVDGGPDPLSDRELLDMLALLLIAGFETTTNVISTGLLTLHDQPEQLAILRAGKSLDHVADEFLRHEASLQFANRVAVEDVEVGDRTIPAGDTVFVMLGAANRDPAVFDHPDRLDFTRPRPKHLTFGGGIHHCLGAALARLELEVLLEQLSARFANVALDGVRPEFRDTLAFRSLESLPAKLQSAAGAGQGCPVHRTDDVSGRVAVLETQPLFSACRPSELVRLAQSAEIRTFADGEVIVEQGQVSDEAFVILEGEAEVLIGNDLVANLGADDLIGERGVVTATPRAATVRATTHVAAYRLDLDHLREVLDNNPTASATMIAVTAARYPADASA